MFLNLKKIPKIKNNILLFPQSAGVYIFWEYNTPLYIGKAINLKKRVVSYFSNSVFGKTKIMVNSSTALSYIKVESDLEAILLEAKLIRKLKPKYNFELKDDKNPLYIQITDDKLPRILTIRKPKSQDKYIFGPFPSTSKVKAVLKMLRRILPYSTHKVTKKACIDSQMNLCNPCPSYIENLVDKKFKLSLEKEYLENIKLIKGILNGRIKYVRKMLQNRMLKYSNKQLYEQADKVKNKMDLLDYITNPRPNVDEYLKNPNFYQDIRKKENKELINILKTYFKIKKIKRIECYDVSHISGISIAASMVTFINGEADKSLYRRFKIRLIKKADDISSLNQVIKRRIKHFNSWGKPDLIIVDGGKAQLKIFYNNLYKYKIPVIGIAKKFETLIFYKNSRFYQFSCKGYSKNFLQRIRNEAHRFAKAYHQKLFKKYLFNY